MLPPVAHLGDVASSAPLVSLLVGAAFVFGFGLSLQHLWVKHGRLHRRHVLGLGALIVSVLLGGTFAPTSVVAQVSDEPRGLPDLISDPPRNWDTKNVRTPSGEVIRVITFDGHLHNIGTGKLDVSGNPQLVDGMKQRVFDGDEWSVVGSPTVRFETNDGHNHFHFMAAADYGLWTNDRSERVSDASKVGFCLIDTEQMEEGYDASYLIDDFNYCGADQPDATELTMGISPGWRDTYDSNVTFQWVDISDVEPGLYWTSATVDPNDEIVESNEDNNEIVFSRSRFAVDGYVARELGSQSPGDIQLKADTYGIVGTQAFVLSTAPSKGTFDVPTGVDLIDRDVIRYTPVAGATGTDSFAYYAHDTSSPFPRTPTIVEVTVELGTSTNTSPDSPAEADQLTDKAIVELSEQVVSMHQPVSVDFASADTPAATTGDVQWYARALPAGLTIDIDSGTVTGVPTFASTVESVIVASTSDTQVERAVQWTVSDELRPSLSPTNDFSTLGPGLLRKSVGSGTPGATYRATGLPEGGGIVPNSPMITGVARESGTFSIVVEEVIDDVVVGTTSFDWIVRPSTRPMFPL